ncbi:Aldo/keto reductase [Bimuria novae-zelandiae CBS 107.79]|uniref:Aldo/keto reductase n=1 Tax=Bimuria novae-zelandiae CBS 107.79 TaxID=1447943 RepID=A0A6A5UQ57_9PLEO|nr:Aldo/keto reductase [Bimuria novae-zelandiae CBS 107.79]
MRVQIAFLCFIGLSHCRNDQQPIGVNANKVDQPPIGFGTWNLKENPSNTTDAVAFAIEKGYRQIDCAAAYGNEEAVGKGIHKGLKQAGLKREEIWVTSKLWNDHHAPDRVEEGLNQTLKDLDLDYLDLYLMHWPVGKGPDDKKYYFDYVETWQAMTKLLSTGRVRKIGISNFSPAQLEDLVKHNLKGKTPLPAVHQMELHPYLPQSKWILVHKAHGIAVTAYSPLGNMNPTYGDRSRRSITTQSKAPLLLENETIKEIAEKRECTPAQVVLAWGISRGTSVIPKSKHENYIEENLGALNCGLAAGDLADIDQLGKDPVRFNNPSDGWGVDLFEGLDGV